MNKNTTIVLLGALVLLLVAMLALRDGEPVAEEGSERLWPDFAKSDVSEMSWQTGAGELLVRRVEGSTEDWVLVLGGHEVPASGSSVTEVLGDLDRIRVRGRIAAADVDAGDRQSYGLEPVRGFLSIVLRGEVRKVSFGAEGLARDRVYASRSGEEDVLLVDDDLLETLRETTVEKIREKKFTELTVYDVGSLRVTTPEGVRFAATRSKERRTEWVAEAPYRGELDPQAMERDQLPAVLKTEASEFVADGVGDEDLPEYGLDSPRFRIEVGERSGEKKRTLLLGGDVPEKEGLFYFMVEGEPFVYEGGGRTLLEQLGRDPAELRDRNLTRLGWSVLGKVAVEHGGVAYEMVKDGSEWRLEAPEKMELDAGAVEEWLDGVRGLQVREFLDEPDLAALGLSEPAGRLTFWKPEEKEHEHGDEKDVEETPLLTLRIGGAAGDGVHVLREGAEGTAFEVGPELPALLERGHHRFKKRELFDKDLGSREVVEVRRRTGEEDLTVTKEEGRWTEGVDAVLVNKLVRDLLDVRAERWIGKAEGREEECGLAEGPFLSLRITLKKGDDGEAGPEEYGVDVGKETEGGRFARAIRADVPGPDVFVISTAELEILKRELRRKEKPKGPEEEKDEKPEEPDEEAGEEKKDE